MNDQVTASTRPRCGERAARGRAQLLRRSDARAADRLGAPHRQRRHAVVAVMADQLLDDIRLHADVVAPGRRRHPDRPGAVARHLEAQALELLADRRHLQRDPRKALQLVDPEPEGAGRLGHGARHDRRTRLAAAQLQDQPGRVLGAGQHHRRVDAALEAGARVALDAEPAAGRRGTDRIEQRHLEHHIHGLRRAAGALAAHDAAKADGTTVVGDHGHAGLERVGPAVERLELLALLGKAQAQIALQLSRVEHVQRPAEVHGHEVGDVDQGRDRPQPDRGQALLQPRRARPVAHAAEHPADEQRAGRRVALREIRA